MSPDRWGRRRRRSPGGPRGRRRPGPAGGATPPRPPSARGRSGPCPDHEAGLLGGGGEHPVGGDHAGAADAREVDAVGAVDLGGSGHGEVAGGGRGVPAATEDEPPDARARQGPSPPPRGTGLEGDEGRTGRRRGRSSPCCTTPGGSGGARPARCRGHREAVALHRAVAAALAHRLVDHDPPRRLGLVARLRRRGPQPHCWS